MCCTDPVWLTRQLQLSANLYTTPHQKQTQCYTIRVHQPPQQHISLMLNPVGVLPNTEALLVGSAAVIGGVECNCNPRQHQHTRTHTLLLHTPSSNWMMHGVMMEHTRDCTEQCISDSSARTTCRIARRTCNTFVGPHAKLQQQTSRRVNREQQASSGQWPSPPLHIKAGRFSRS